MAKLSAGLLVFRRGDSSPEVLLAHPGGPFWAKKDDGAWSIPKGEYEEGEDAQAAALREFREELGIDPPRAPLRELGEIKQPSGKRVIAWAVEGDADVSEVKSDTFALEWPPRSGKRVDFPEVDRAQWFSIADARRKLNPGQVEFLGILLDALGLPRAIEAAECDEPQTQDSLF